MAKVSAVGRQHTGDSSGSEILPMNARQSMPGLLPANRGPPGAASQRPATPHPSNGPRIANPGDQEYAGLPGQQVLIVEGEGKFKNFPHYDQATALARDTSSPMAI